MDLLKSVTKRRSKKGNKGHKSRVQQFYSEFQSSSPSSSSRSSSSSSSSSSSRSPSPFGGLPSVDPQPRVFTFEHVKAPRTPQNGSVSTNGSSRRTPRSRSQSGSGPRHRRPLKSPGVTRNQQLKDEALSIVYQNKIKDLRSARVIFVTSV